MLILLNFHLGLTRELSVLYLQLSSSLVLGSLIKFVSVYMWEVFMVNGPLVVKSVADLFGDLVLFRIKDSGNSPNGHSCKWTAVHTSTFTNPHFSQLP